MLGITHSKVSGIPNPGDPTKVGGSDWDADHAVVWASGGDIAGISTASSAGTSLRPADGAHVHDAMGALPRFTSNLYYAPSGAIDYALLTLNRLYAIPLVVGTPTFFNRLACVTLGTVATAKVKLGLYTDNNGGPGTRLATSGALDASGAGLITYDFTSTQVDHVVWLALVAQTVVPTVQIFSGGGIAGHHDVRIGVSDPSASTVGDGFYQDSISGSLPDPWGATAGSTWPTPMIWLRAS